MRITNSMIVNKFLSDANGSLNRVSKYQSQVDSTKRISRISDDPLATITALKARNRLSNLSLYQSNISAASSYLTEAESSVSSLNEICQKAYEDMQSALSGGKTQDELDVIKEEFENLKKEVISIGNNSMGSSYIFGGYNFTGKNGVTKVAPFSLDANGNLIYNDINLSQFSWKEEFDNCAALLTSTADGSYIDKLGECSTGLATASDYYAKNTLCETAKEVLSGILSTAKSALESAKEFGIDSGSNEYKALSFAVQDFTKTDDKINNLFKIYNDLFNEASKELAGNYILDTDPSIIKNSDGTINTEYYTEKGITVMTQAELDNRFSTTRAKTLLDSAYNEINNSWVDYNSDTHASLLTAVNDLKSVITTDSTKLVEEEKKRSSLPIGIDQNIEFGVTGLELLGTGNENIYHILDKCSKLLGSGASANELSNMITELQGAQQNVLTLQTKIGSTQNRLDLISDRYTTSEANYTKIKSEAEDADMAEAITNLNTAKTVYSAALAAGAKIMQTSLIDFLT